jgi:hypothetical protein
MVHKSVTGRLPERKSGRKCGFRSGNARRRFLKPAIFSARAAPVLKVLRKREERSGPALTSRAQLPPLVLIAGLMPLSGSVSSFETGKPTLPRRLEDSKSKSDQSHPSSMILTNGCGGYKFRRAMNRARRRGSSALAKTSRKRFSPYSQAMRRTSTTTSGTYWFHWAKERRNWRSAPNSETNTIFNP